MFSRKYNRSRDLLWEEIVRLYLNERMKSQDIIKEIKVQEYFDPKLIPTSQAMYDRLSREGHCQARKEAIAIENGRKKELAALAASKNKEIFEKAKQAILNGLNSGDLSIDDLTRENLSCLQAMIKDLSDKIGSTENDKDKMEAVKLLDKVVQTLLKARILEDKPTEKTEGSVEVSLQQEMKDFFKPTNEN
jgi:hypothetical protein